MSAIDETLRTLTRPFGSSIQLSAGRRIAVSNPKAARQHAQELARIAATGLPPARTVAQWLIRELALQLGCLPCSIHDLYVARGRGLIRNDFTVPAVNLRALPYAAARAVFRAAQHIDAGAFIFEIARSEMGYTDQTPAEYAASVLAAALVEGFTGPVFIQGDHFQVSARRYAQEPRKEVQALRTLIRESILAGFYNIDIDTSTLVDLSKPTIPAQQETNFSLCAALTRTIREGQPRDVTISVGGEIGEVGGHNSTEPELRAFMEGYHRELARLAPSAPGLSKISIQTGTSHGGVVLPDGSLAQVSIDFDTLKHLSKVARKSYGMAGAVQHGASTLPVEAFSRFVDCGTCEVHLATHFQTMLFEHLPSDLREAMYAFVRDNFSSERKAGQTDEQFYYSSRKRALGPFKQQLWEVPASAVEAVSAAWEKQFALLFDRLNIAGTRLETLQFVRPVPVRASLTDCLKTAGVQESASDLAD